MRETMIYLDNAATTFPKPECVYRAMEEAGRNYGVNAGRGSYALAREASAVIEETREWIKCLSGADSVAEVVFTPSATVACNQVFGGLEWKKEDVVYVSPFEHNAVMRVLHLLQKKYGFAIEELALEEETLELDLEKIRFQFLRKKPTVVAVTHVSNVTGYILPVEEVAKSAAEQGAVVVVDGSQGLGLVPVCLKNLPVDFYIFAGHKTLYGPVGTGGFLQSGRIALKPYLAGGTGSSSLDLEMSYDVTGLEPGSPNVPAIAGLRAAVVELCGEAGGIAWEKVAEVLEREQRMAEYLINRLGKIPGVKLYLPKDRKRRAGIVAFNVEGYQASEVGMLLDEDYGIAVRTGYQCAPLIHKHLQTEEFLGVVRAGVGRFTTEEELEALADAVREIAEG
ncbi:MAG: aminotransferase class V-fold PLP-dependent enzyme [Roseburia sp.]|nr:aminotransferase class V-fold PLP-dependent enzyme [Roseburia sp.]